MERPQTGVRARTALPSSDETAARSRRPFSSSRWAAGRTAHRPRPPPSSTGCDGATHVERLRQDSNLLPPTSKAQGHPAEEGQRRQDEVRLSGGGGPLQPVGEPAVRQDREPLQGQGTAGAVVAQPLEARDVVLVEPGVGVEREALDEGTPAGRPARRRARPAPWHLDAFELEDIEPSSDAPRARARSLSPGNRS